MSAAPRPAILAAAFSARQIAMSAGRAGFDALAVDFFHDADLEALARRSRRLAGPYPDGFESAALLEALEDLAGGLDPVGFVYGAGFEDRPELVEAIAARWPVLGTNGETLRAVKNPERFADICAATGIAHPGIARDAPADREGWLSKQAGGAGGSHVRHAVNAAPAVNRYYQRLVTGARWSAAFLAAGDEGFVLGFTRQWTAPTLAEPFRYGGAVGPLPPPEPAGEAMRQTLLRFLRHLPLRGLCSADFVVSEDGTPWLLEINPRFGATVDVFDTQDEPLLALHLAACDGCLPASWRGPDAIRATGLAWAEVPTDLAAGSVWPHFARDLPRLPTRIIAGEPICTILAEGPDETQAVAQFHARAAAIRQASKRTAA